ncbi:MAG: leucine-rich repeat domain-containing protein, partial [Candidatus Ornithomonoglobus sp.]
MGKLTMRLIAAVLAVSAAAGITPVSAYTGGLKIRNNSETAYRESIETECPSELIPTIVGDESEDVLNEHTSETTELMGDGFFYNTDNGFDTPIQADDISSPFLLPEEADGAVISFAEDAEIIAEGDCGAKATWTLDSNGTLTIGGEGAMTNYSNATNVPWYSQRSEITSAIIEEGVTSVGGCAFYECTSLSDVAIPEGVTSVGSFAFYKCGSLTEVVLPESVDTIGKYAFYSCSG